MRPRPPPPVPAAPVVDFVGGSAAHRRRYGGGKGQMLAKAVGIKPGVLPDVLDLTAGLGGDAFVLATLGCRVTMVERHPALFQVLQDGLQRARAHALDHDRELVAILDRMTLHHVDAVEFLANQPTGLDQVIYLDPMFPERQGTAAPKKHIVWLQATVGPDPDSETLFARAVQADPSRIVVKRPRHAQPLGGVAPPLTFEGASSRFDVYPKRALSRDRPSTPCP